MTDDRTKAAALQLAKEDLEKRGWRYSAEDIGKTAAKIILAMTAELEKESK